MCEDSLWSDYADEYYSAMDEPGLTGEAYKAALTDDVLDDLSFMAMLLESVKK